MRITLNEKCKKHFYIYQNDEKVGVLKKKKNLINVNNNSPVLIRKTTLVKEIIYYSIVGACFICGLIWARIFAAVALLLCAYVINPFDLSRKTDYYIKRPTGQIELDYTDFKTNADVILKPRFQFLHIRFWCLQLGLCLVWSSFIEGYFETKSYFWWVLLSIYIFVQLIIVWITTKRYVKAIKEHKEYVKNISERLENI